MAKKDNEEIPFSASPSAGNSEKLKALQAAMDKIEKTFGKGSIMKMVYRLERRIRGRRLSQR